MMLWQWRESLVPIRGSIVFIDECNSFVKSEDFAISIKESDNNFVIITRNDLPNLPLKAGAKIVPVRLDIKKSLKFPSWDKFQVPLPFSSVEVIFGDGFFVTEELTEEYLTDCHNRLQKELNELLPHRP